MRDSFDLDFDHLNIANKEQHPLTLMNNSSKSMDDNSENEDELNYLYPQYFKCEGEKCKNDDYINYSTVNDSSNKNIELLLSSEKNNGKNQTPNNKKPFIIYKERIRNINNRYDNMKKKIARHFFNTYLIKERGGHLKFKKFPRTFFNNLNEKAINDIWNSTLENILNKKELYLSNKSNSINDYLPNSDIIDELELEEDNNIMNKSEVLKKEIKDLFKEYLVSDCYNEKIISIEKKYEKNYVDNYKYYSTHFVK